MNVREGTRDDLPAVIEIDPAAKADSSRADAIERSIEFGTCFVCVGDGQRILGYGTLDYSFYGRGFISLVYVSPDARRSGLGTRLLERLEGRCQTADLFTSTNRSNTAMRSLLAKRDFDESGIIHNLDPGDPEVVYFKALREPTS